MDDSEKLEDIETRLIAQEHRLFSVLQNFFVERPKWGAADPRRDAAAKALIWCLFFSPGTVAVAGSIVGLATLGVLIWQNTLIVEQNEYFQRQIEQQQLQIQSQDQISTQTDRNNAIQAIYGPEFRENPRIKAEAIRTLVVIERSRIETGENVFESDYVNLHDADLQGVHIENFDLKNVSFRGSDLRKIVFSGIDMHGSAFRFANLQEANFFRSDLSSTYWDSADLKEADLSGANLLEANMVRADLRGANLEGVENWETLFVQDAKVHSVKNAPDGFFEWAKENGADTVSALE